MVWHLYITFRNTKLDFFPIQDRGEEEITYVWDKKYDQREATFPNFYGWFVIDLPTEGKRTKSFFSAS